MKATSPFNKIKVFRSFYAKLREFSFILLVVTALGAASCSTRLPAGAYTTRYSESGFSPMAECLPKDCFSSAVDERLNGGTLNAVSKLNTLRRQFPGTIWAARASFLLGVVSLESSQAQFLPAVTPRLKPRRIDTEAIRYLREALVLEDIRDYIRFYLAGAYRSADRYNEAINEYEIIINDFPGSLLIPRVLFEKASTLAVTNRSAGAIEVLRELVQGYPQDPLVPEALLLKAHLSWAERLPGDSAAALRRIITKYPTHRTAPKAEEFIKLLELNDIEVKGLSAVERYMRGKAFFSMAHYDEAIEEFTVAVDSADGSRLDEAAIDLSVAMLRLKRYKEAEETLKDYLNSNPAASKRLTALYWLGFSAFRRGDPVLLAEAERALKNESPKSWTRARILLYSAGLYEKRGEDKKARRLYRSVLDEFTGTVASEAAWRLGWEAYRSKRYQEALATFNGFLSSGSGGNNGRGVTEAEKFYYWSGRSAERLGSKKLAEELYGKACAPSLHTFYCHMATDRRADLGVVPHQKDRDTPEDKIMVAVTEDNSKIARLKKEPRYLAARELITLGFNAEASAELDLLIDRYSDEKTPLIELSSLFYRAGDFYRGLKIYYRYLPVITDGSPHLTGELLKIAFPLEVVDMVKRVSTPGYADAYLVAAVMREESTFNPVAVSRTGALGLMQIMPQTGDFIAKKNGDMPLKEDELLNPKVNIRFGSWYLAHLAQRFDNDLVFTVAGYNAGPTAVRRWVKMGPVEPDEFIESIPYEETRTYTKRVIKSYTEFLKAAGYDAGVRFERPLVTRSKGKNSGAQKDIDKDKNAG